MLDWHWQQVQIHVRRNQYNSFPKPGTSAQVANSDGKDSRHTTANGIKRLAEAWHGKGKGKVGNDSSGGRHGAMGQCSNNICTVGQ